MANLDLNAARAARAEATAEPRSFEFGEPAQRFNLPQELPFEVAEAMTAGDVRSVMDLLLNGQAEGFWALKPTVPDLVRLTEWISEEYTGEELGEPSASSSPSEGDGESTRQPSEASTTST